jgi:hypothetical protein
MREQIQDKGHLPTVCKVAECRADRKACEHIALPLAPDLDPSDHIVRRQHLLRVHPGMIMAVFQDDRISWLNRGQPHKRIKNQAPRREFPFCSRFFFVPVGAIGATAREGVY